MSDILIFSSQITRLASLKLGLTLAIAFWCLSEYLLYRLKVIFFRSLCLTPITELGQIKIIDAMHLFDILIYVIYLEDVSIVLNIIV
jgi:hypothetical protein